MPYSDVTLPELARNIDALRSDLRTFAGSHVSAERYAAEHQALVRDLTDLRETLAAERAARETERKADHERGERMRLLVVGALVSGFTGPIIGFVVSQALG